MPGPFISGLWLAGSLSNLRVIPSPRPIPTAYPHGISADISGRYRRFDTLLRRVSCLTRMPEGTSGCVCEPLRKCKKREGFFGVFSSPCRTRQSFYSPGIGAVNRERLAGA